MPHLGVGRVALPVRGPIFACSFVALAAKLLCLKRWTSTVENETPRSPFLRWYHKNGQSSTRGDSGFRPSTVSWL